MNISLKTIIWDLTLWMQAMAIKNGIRHFMLQVRIYLHIIKNLVNMRFPR